MALYMIGFITYGATLVFYAAQFPRLARNTAHARQLQDRYEAGDVPREEYEIEESLEKNRISNVSTVGFWELYINSFNRIDLRQTHSNIGYIATLCLNLSILLPLANNPKVNNYTLVLWADSFLPFSVLLYISQDKCVLGRDWHMVVYIHLPLANHYCYLYLVSYLPTTTPWSSFAKRRNLPHNWMETGSSVSLRAKREIYLLSVLLDLGCLQAVQAITLYFHLPFRLLSPRRCMFEIPAFFAFITTNL